MQGNSLIVWIVIGAIAGVVTSMVMGSGGSWLFDIVLGIVGAVVGGWLSSQLGGPSVSGINIPSIVVAFFGSCLCIWILRQIQRRRPGPPEIY